MVYVCQQHNNSMLVNIDKHDTIHIEFPCVSLDVLDLSPTSFELAIPLNENKACKDILAIDDKIALEGNQTFQVRVTIIDPPQVSSVVSTSTITVVDNDGMCISILLLNKWGLHGSTEVCWLI